MEAFEDLILRGPTEFPARYRFAKVVKLNPFTILPAGEIEDVEIGPASSLTPIAAGDTIYYQTKDGLMVVLGKVYDIV